MKSATKVVGVLPDSEIVEAAIHDLENDGYKIRFVFGVNAGVMIVAGKGEKNGPGKERESTVHDQSARGNRGHL